MLTKTEIAAYKRKLETMRNQLASKLDLLRAEGTLADGGASDASATLDLADKGSHEFEEVVTLGLADNEQHLMEEIDAALERIDEGKFGECERCELDIGRDRLRAVPYSRLCRRCTTAENEFLNPFSSANALTG